MITGKLNGISRAEVKSLIEENAGAVVSSVSKKLNYLIAGEKPTKRKIEAAKNLLLNFQEKLTGEIEGYDIYALFETADLYFSLGFSDLAKKYFLYCDKVLEEKKKNYGIEKYNMGKRMISEKLKLIEQAE